MAYRLTTSTEPTALYRLYDEADRLLYIGITRNLAMRWQKHASQSSWWPEVRRREVTWYDSRPEARAAEIAAIGTERPIHNKYETAEAKRKAAPRRKAIPEVAAAAPEIRRSAPMCTHARQPCQRRDTPGGCFGMDGIGYPCLLAAATPGTRKDYSHAQT